MLAPPRARQNGNVVLPASRAKAAEPAAQGFSESGLVSSPIPQVPAIASQVDYPREDWVRASMRRGEAAAPRRPGLRPTSDGHAPGGRELSGRSRVPIPRA